MLAVWGPISERAGRCTPCVRACTHGPCMGTFQARNPLSAPQNVMKLGHNKRNEIPGPDDKKKPIT